MNQSRPLKLKNKNLTQIFFDNLYFLLFPLIIEIELKSFLKQEANK